MNKLKRLFEAMKKSGVPRDEVLEVIEIDDDSITQEMLESMLIEVYGEAECFEIKDWAGNLMPFGRFETWDDAEEFLCEFLNDDYEESRQEYFIFSKLL